MPGRNYLPFHIASAWGNNTEFSRWMWRWRSSSNSARRRTMPGRYYMPLRVVKNRLSAPAFSQGPRRRRRVPGACTTPDRRGGEPKDRPHKAPGWQGKESPLPSSCDRPVHRPCRNRCETPPPRTGCGRRVLGDPFRHRLQARQFVAEIRMVGVHDVADQFHWRQKGRVFPRLGLLGICCFQLLKDRIHVSPLSVQASLSVRPPWQQKSIPNAWKTRAWEGFSATISPTVRSDVGVPAGVKTVAVWLMVRRLSRWNEFHNTKTFFI